VHRKPPLPFSDSGFCAAHREPLIRKQAVEHALKNNLPRSSDYWKKNSVEHATFLARPSSIRRQLRWCVKFDAYGACGAADRPKTAGRACLRCWSRRTGRSMREVRYLPGEHTGGTLCCGRPGACLISGCSQQTATNQAGQSQLRLEPANTPVVRDCPAIMHARADTCRACSFPHSRTQLN